MALFKISRGNRSNLPTAMTDGWAYFCTDTAEFYIDYKDSSGTLCRKAINAKEAEALSGYDIATILNSSNLEIPTSKAVLDALDNKVDKQTGKGLSSNDYTTDEKNKLDGIEEGANAYTLPTASSTLGGVKTTSTVTSTTGLTACPIISGVPYYKDTNNTYTNATLGQGYGTCATAAATTAKAVTLSNYTLITGGIVAVKFTYDVPASATLNINSKGAKAIYYKGAAITADVIKAGDVATFIYNGSQYHLLSIDTSLPQTGGTIGTVKLTQGSTFGDALPATMSANQLFFVKMNIYEYLYPVGAIYLTAVNTNPSSLFGVGTWSSITSPISGKYAFQRTA